MIGMAKHYITSHLLRCQLFGKEIIFQNGKDSITKYIFANIFGDKKLKALMYCYRIWCIFDLTQILLIMTWAIIYKYRISIRCIITFAYIKKATLVRAIRYLGNLYKWKENYVCPVIFHLCTDFSIVSFN